MQAADLKPLSAFSSRHVCRVGHLHTAFAAGRNGWRWTSRYGSRKSERIWPVGHSLQQGQRSIRGCPACGRQAQRNPDHARCYGEAPKLSQRERQIKSSSSCCTESDLGRFGDRRNSSPAFRPFSRADACWIGIHTLLRNFDPASSITSSVPVKI
jgi:hypothetical protein